MVVMRHAAKYQQFQATAIEYARTEGFEPDPGWLMLRMEDVKKVLVAPFKGGLWRGQSGFIIDGGLDIRSWHAAQRRLTVTEPRPLPDIKGGGLNQFGELRMQTFVGKKGKLDEVIYQDIYIEDAGLEDLASGLAEQKKHKVGTLFVPITDIRKYYKEFGPLFCRINVRNPDDSWEEGSVQEDGTPWPADIVLRFVFSQLPGTPTIVKRSPLKDTIDDEKLKLDPPTNIIARGEPASEWAQKILDELGMTPRFQPNGRYIVAQDGAEGSKYGTIPVSPGKTEKGKHQHSETQTVNITSTPELVMVIGKTRIRRTTEDCIPVLMDDEGRIREQGEVLREIGYPLRSARIACIQSPESAFFDVKPAPTSDILLHDRRREMLKLMCFKAYAPFSCMIVDDGGRLVLDPDARGSESLAPLHDFAAYLDELPALEKKIPTDKETEKGDRDDIQILAPLVRAKSFRETLFKDFDEIRSHFKRFVSSEFSSLGFWRRFETQKRTEAKTFGASLIKASVKLPTGFNTQKARDTYLTKLGVDTNFIKLDDDVNRALGFVSELGSVTHRLTQKDMTEKNSFTLKRVKQLLASAKFARRKQREAFFNARSYIAQFKSLRDSFVDHGAVAMLANAPHALMPEGSYNLDRQSGLITFKEVTGHMRRPYLLEGEHFVNAIGLVSDGAVTVTFGYEYKTGTMLDFTTVLVAAGLVPDPKTGKVKFKVGPGGIDVIAQIAIKGPGALVVGLNRPTPLTPKIARSPKMRMYEADLGTPMNLTSVVTQALQRAAGDVARPPASTGFTYVWSGLRKAVLDVGVSVIQHEWPVGRDRGTAHTTIGVNSRTSRGLLAGAPTARRIGKFQTKAREMILSDLEDQK